VNVWLAASWARHAQHRRAKAWLDQDEGPLAFCRVTQMSLLRLITNPSVTGRDTRTRRQAWDLMDQLLADPRVTVLAEPDNLVPLWMAFSKRDDRDHLLWTDDYLAAFAVAAEIEIVTLDRPFEARYPSAKVVVLA
jgi:toxin-antitoxin system PIN domain toxin